MASLITNPQTGESLVQEEWASRLGISVRTLQYRLKTRSPEIALSINKKEPTLVTHPQTGESLSIKEWAEKLNINYNTLRSRIKIYPLEIALTPINKTEFITHPKTGETLTRMQWAEKLRINYFTLRNRLQRQPIEIALRPHIGWTNEEDDYLILVYRSPNLLFLWNQVAEKRGWRQRTIRSLNSRISFLIEQQEISSRRKTEEADGWLLATQLSECLGISRTVVCRWTECGLKGYLDGDRIKIHLHHFAAWAVSPIGAGEISKICKSNPLAFSWILVQIGNWINEKPPQVGQGNRNKCIN